MRLDPKPIHAALLDIAESHTSGAAASQSFSGAVHISSGPETLHAEGFGYAQRAERIVNQADTAFGTASGTKTFTAAAVLRLVGDGRLRLDSPLSEIVPVEFPLLDRGITVRHLLTHTAGNPDYFDEDVMSDYGALWAERPMYGILAPADFIPLFRDRPMKFAPGARFSYSNAGYILLGLVIEAATGLPFHLAIEETVFAPAGMIGSGLFRLDRLPRNTAYGYIEASEAGTVDEVGWRTNQYSIPVIGGPDGGAFTTGLDMQRFWNALLDGRLMDPEHAAAMLGPQVSVSADGDDVSSHYGYGVWVHREEGEEPRSFALGADPGVSFISALWPESRLTITVLSNSDQGMGMAWRALRTVIGW